MDVIDHLVSPTVDTELRRDTTGACGRGYRGILPSEVAEATRKALLKDKYEIVIGEARGSL
jgi:hypothetical protein